MASFYTQGKIVIEGSVHDYKTSVRMTGVTITELYSGRIFSTNNEGKYKIKIHSDSAFLQFSHRGFKTFRLKFDGSCSAEIGLVPNNIVIFIPNDTSTNLSFPYGKKPILAFKSKSKNSLNVYSSDTLELKTEVLTKCVHFIINKYHYYISREEIIESLNRAIKTDAFFEENKSKILIQHLNETPSDTVFIDLENKFISMGRAFTNVAVNKIDTGIINLYSSDKKLITSIIREAVVSYHSFAAWGGYQYFAMDNLAWVINHTMFLME